MVKMLPRSSVLLLLLGLLVFTASPLAGAAGLDRDGDGEVATRIPICAASRVQAQFCDGG